MSLCQEQSLLFLSILTHPKLLCAFMDLSLCVSTMNKAMRRKWFAFKLMKTMYEILNIQMEITKCINACKSAYTNGYALI